MSKRRFYAKRTGKTTTPVIWIDGKRITEGVTSRLRTVYYRMERRERYLEERDIDKFQILHTTDLFGAGEEEITGENLFVSAECVQNTVEDSFAIKQLQEAINLLSDKEQLIIHEIYYEDKTQREVAKMLGISQPALRKQHIRIVNKLKTFLV